MQQKNNSPQPFRMPVLFTQGLPARMESAISGHLASFIRLRRLNEIYAQLPVRENALDFFPRVLEALNFRAAIDEADIARIPREGACIIVCNHPYGMVECLLLGNMLRQVRTDFKLLGNYMISAIPELNEFNIAVDPFGGDEAKRRNIAPMREALRHLRNGGLLILLPAGEVAHLGWGFRPVTDSPWIINMANFIRHAKAPVLPVFIGGTNSPIFHALGLVHPRLRTVMLPRELLNMNGKTIPLHIGTLIPADRLASITADEELLAYIRMRTYLLNSSPAATPSPSQLLPPDHMTSAHSAPIATAEPLATLANEIAGLGAEELMCENGEYQVFVAPAARVPHTLYELGRQREIAFRGVGEGTGKPLDLDKFDDYYLHLFLWNKEKKEIAGAYRLGKSDEILPRFGMKGLYTHTLFHINITDIQEFVHGLELGRSFVRAEYQRSFSPLMLLWKGIGQFIVRHPHYRYLFGPVSISDEYTTMSRQLMVAFLEVNHYETELAKQVKARQPMRWQTRPETDPRKCACRVANLDELAALIVELEQGSKGIPILLKQYLNLGARLLGFNVDPEFSNVVDGLILVDLTTTKTRVLDKYMGKDGLTSFLAFHGIERPNGKLEAETEHE